jgi:DNA-binding transcriptional MocR family regulator
MIIPGLQIDVGSDVPVYRQIAKGVLAAVADGRLQDSHRLPPTRDLARQLGVNRNTVVAAYDHLAGEGWVQSQTGRGTFLVSRQEAPAVAIGNATEAWCPPFSRAVEGATAGALKSIYKLINATEGISFVGSYPTPELMPVSRFSQAMAKALKESGPQVLSYGPTAGNLALRETIAHRMRQDGSTVSAADVMITNGAQQALELVFRCFIERGDTVITEEPTYTGTLSILQALGARVVGVPVDEHGIRPDLLAAALERHKPKLLYVQPNFQNPTTRVMSEARRRELLSLVRHARCLLIEDDWGGELRFEGRDLPSLHALDGGAHVIYLSTFSKKLMPGLRVGWLVAPRVVLEPLVELKRMQDCGTSTLLQAALQLFLKDGGLEEHLERVRPVYLKRRNCMIEALQRHFPSEAHYVVPDGGLFVWVVLPANFDGGELFDESRRRGVLYSRGDLFHSDGSGRNAMRLTYSAATESEIESGVAILGKLVRERLDREEPSGPHSIEALPIF